MTNLTTYYTDFTITITITTLLYLTSYTQTHNQIHVMLLKSILNVLSSACLLKKLCIYDKRN